MLTIDVSSTASTQQLFDFWLSLNSTEQLVKDTIKGFHHDDIDEQETKQDETNIPELDTQDKFVISVNENDVLPSTSIVQPASHVHTQLAANTRIDLRVDTATDVRPHTELKQSPPSSPSESAAHSPAKKRKSNSPSSNPQFNQFFSLNSPNHVQTSLSPISDEASRSLSSPLCSPRASPRSPEAPSSMFSSDSEQLSSSSSSLPHVDFSSSIKPFYFPSGQPQPPETYHNDLDMIHRIFAQEPFDSFDDQPPIQHIEERSSNLSLIREEFFPLTQRVCLLSSYCNSALFDAVLAFAEREFSGRRPKRQRSDNDQNGENQMQEEHFERVFEDEFVSYYLMNLAGFDPTARFFRLLRGDSPVSYLTRESLKPVIADIVSRHPGLEFLDATPEFQLKYAQTVIARIFYTVNTSGNERLTLGELRRSNFLLMLGLLDSEEDINKLNDYFSYEHFYVIYCKFWELDVDHDGFIDTSDLLSYDDFAVTSKIVERVTSGSGRPLLSQQSGKFNYLDFVVFLMSEVDKTNPVSIEYWFRCVDLDGDGIITAYEMNHFFEEQKIRIQALSQEQIHFTDIFCQLIDMIKNGGECDISLHGDISANLPELEKAMQAKPYFTRSDLKNSKLAGSFFNTLFNLQKFILSEQRDPIRIKNIHDTPHLSDWDRYAISGYHRLADVDHEQEETETAETDDEDYHDALLNEQQAQQLVSMELDSDSEPH